MKRILLVILAIALVSIITSCSVNISYETYTQEEILDVTEEEIDETLLEWDGPSDEFYLAYMEEPISFDTQEDYYYIICYMLLNHITSYEFTVEYPDYDVDRIYEILEVEVISAYNDATLLLNTYTDFWSRFEASCEQTVAEDGEIVSLVYTFSLSHKNGMSDEEVFEKQILAEEYCYELIEEMFADGSLSTEMMEKERAEVIYQWICENVEYAYDAPSADSDEVKPDNCYSAMIDQYAVCQGITGAYVHLCRLAGVEMYVQYGYTSEEAHSWCKMDVNDEWMYIDPTWGITSTDSEEWFWVEKEYLEDYEKNPRTFTTYVE